MEKKTQTIVRIILVIIGILLLLYGFFGIYTSLEEKIIPKILENDFNFEYKLSEISLEITLIIFSLFLITIGLRWSNIFKTITTTLVSFAVLFLTIAITLYPIYSNSQEIANSVQPSIDYIVAGSFDKILLDNIEISNGEKINLIYNGKTNEITIGNLKENDANLIWKELGFNDTVSYETKNFTINLLLTYTSKELKTNNMEKIPIPLNIVGKFLQNSNQTKDIKKIIEYDFFNKNISLRAENLNKLRTDCENNKIELKEICTPITMTKYETMMKNATNIENSNVPVQLTNVLKDIDTTSKMKIYIEDKSSSWITFTILAIIFIIIGTLSYYLHFKLFNREYKKTEIGYFISKINLINYAPAYIILLITYLFLTGPKLIEIVSQIIPKEMSFLTGVLFSSPIFILFLEILKEMMFISTIYLILSIIIFVIFYFLNKRQ